MRLPEGHAKLLEGQVKLPEGHVKLLEGRVKLVEGRVKLLEGPVKLLEGHVKLLEGHVKLLRIQARGKAQYSSTQRRHSIQAHIHRTGFKLTAHYIRAQTDNHRTPSNRQDPDSQPARTALQLTANEQCSSSYSSTHTCRKGPEQQLRWVDHD